MSDPKQTERKPVPSTTPAPVPDKSADKPAATKDGKEIGGPAGPEPTRFGDWEIKGRCIDF